MSGIVPVNPAAFMGQALVEGVGISGKPATRQDTEQAFVSMLLDKVFLKSFMKDDEEGIFAKEEEDIFGNSQQVSLYKEMVRAEMIKQLAGDERFGFKQLLAQVPAKSI
jgi:hypothetical protein